MSSPRRKLYYRQYWQEHKEERRAPRRQNNQARKLRILGHYSQGDIPRCVQCGERDVDVLTIDHINNDGRQHRRNLGRWGTNFYRWLEKNDCPSGYQTLCFNCNMKKRMEKMRMDNAK